jgi:hypothetical protein
MKSKYILLFAVYCLLFTVFLWGCGGGGPGSPGSEGCEDVGLKCEATVMPTYLGGNTYSLDAFRDDCDPDPLTVDPEDFTDHGATITINVSLLNPNTTFPAGTLYIEKYKVEFRRSTDSIGAPPIESDTRYNTVVITPPTGTGVSTVEFTGILVDLIRKDKYREDILSGQYTYQTSAYLNNYTAIYTIEGKSQYGDRFKINAQTDFQIGWFDYCD